MQRARTGTAAPPGVGARPQGRRRAPSTAASRTARGGDARTGSASRPYASCSASAKSNAVGRRPSGRRRARGRCAPGEGPAGSAWPRPSTITVLWAAVLAEEGPPGRRRRTCRSPRRRGTAPEGRALDAQQVGVAVTAAARGSREGRRRRSSWWRPGSQPLRITAYPPSAKSREGGPAGGPDGNASKPRQCPPVRASRGAPALAPPAAHA